ncbi:MAG: GAF domain-containing protein [Chloroflexota bacterium]
MTKEQASQAFNDRDTHPAAPGFDQAVEAAREDALERVLTAGAGVMAVGAGLHLIAADWIGFVAYALAAAWLYTLRARSHWSLRWRSAGMLGSFYLLAWLGLLRFGLASSAGLFLAILPPLAIVLFGGRVAVPTIIASLLTWLGTGLAFSLELIPLPGALSQGFLYWAYSGVDLLLVVVALSQFMQQFREAQDFVVRVAQQRRDLLDARAELTSRTQQLDYERYLLHTLLETVSDKIFFKDLSGRYTRISQAVAQQFGVPPQQVIGRTDFDFFDVEYARQIQAEERWMLESGQAIIDRVERQIWQDGRPDTWAIESRLPLKGENGKVIGWFGTARDITEIKQAQAADQHHAQQLATIAEVGRAVTSSLEIGAMLRVLVDLLKSSFGYYGVNVWLLDEAGERLSLRAGVSPQGDDLGQAQIELSLQSESALVRVCQTHVHHLDDLGEGHQPTLITDKFPQTRARLALPLLIADKILGVLEILSNQEQVFRAEDVVLLRSLADQLTIAIRNISLYQSEQARRHLAETLYQVGRTLSSTLNLGEVLARVLKLLDEIVTADRSAVMLRQGDELVFEAVQGFPDVPLDQARVQVRDDGIFGRIFRTQQPLAIPDVATHPDWQRVEGLPQARSWLGVPLMRADQVIGALSLTRETFQPYAPNEITLAQTFAGQASLALENAQLYDNLERFNQRLEEMVQARTEELRLAYAQLERLDRTKSDFIRVTSHELRTPLTVMSGYTQMLVQDEMVQQSPGRVELVEGILTGSRRLHEIVNSMLDIAKIDNRALELSTEPLPLIFLLKNATTIFEEAARQRGLALSLVDIHDLPPVEVDTEALTKVFYHLVSNAIKYTPDGGKITISGRAVAAGESDLDQDGVEIIVSDTGIGIDPEQYELIFSKFYQTGEVALHSTGKTKFKGGGPGLGLPIARGIVQAHGGKLWVESPGHDEVTLPGSHFHVLLPVRQRTAAPGATK